jgi:hypothetical protein
LNGSLFQRTSYWDTTLLNISNVTSSWTGGVLEQTSLKMVSFILNVTNINFFNGVVDMKILTLGNKENHTICLLIDGVPSGCIFIDSKADSNCRYFPDQPYPQGIHEARFTLPDLSGKSATLTLSSPSTASIYIGNLSIHLMMCPPETSEKNFDSTPYCSCKKGYYVRNSNNQKYVCAKCPFFCKICNGPSRNECQETVETYVLRYSPNTITQLAVFDKGSK